MPTTVGRKLNDFYEAYWFLYNHPIFDASATYNAPAWTFIMFDDCLDIMVVKVNPATKRVEDDKYINTETRIWLECGPWSKPTDPELKALENTNPGTIPPHGMPSHDIDLDCGGATFEEAIVKLANLVLKNYGDYQPPTN